MERQRTYLYLIDPVETRAALRDFLQQPVIGLDTETYFDQTTRANTLSLLQLAAPSGEVLVIDALSASIKEARALIEHPAVIMAAHNARFDDTVLRNEGWAPEGFIDTLKLARRALQLDSYGLASVSAHLLNVRLDKQWQMSNWRQRPLSRQQLDYAALDAEVALRVYERLTERLQESGKLEAELKRARLRRPEEKPEDKQDALVPGARPLTGTERVIAERIRVWRKQLAERERVPLYFIIQDKTVEQLAIERPRTTVDLKKIYGLGPSRISKYGTELLTLIHPAAK